MARCRNLASIRGRRQAHPPSNIRTGTGVQAPAAEDVIRSRRRFDDMLSLGLAPMIGALFRRKRVRKAG